MTAPAPPSPSEHHPHPAVSALWIFIGATVALATLSWGTIQVVAQLAHEQRVEAATVPAAGVRSVEVTLGEGSVEVVGTDAPRIRLRARVSRGLSDTTFDHHVVDGVLQVRGRCQPPNFGPWCRVALRLEVPRRLAVTVTTGEGRIQVAGLAGALRLATDAGPIRGVHLRSATVAARSDAGSVRLQFDRPPTAASARSDAGAAEIVVPDDGTTYRTTVRSDAGSERTEVPTDPKATRTLTAVTDAGSATVRAAPG